ncbi:ABC transporter substrate-binding protein [Phreatobacter aquaticus]|uniref:ABC transporter substrate-binding protein n=1 Tax=Phreatobacter aquaticus TaxID=2570229 RepID=A0A4D7QLJ6_9HYPH|nr:ABC transporter substrate-binding protein [Phreatobacter aquaticus]QCK88045.1 ABC transporter substrate-binding protein [Phreatobacter aquaticus]
MHRRSFLAGLSAPFLLSASAGAQTVSRAQTLRVVPETLTTILDPHFTTSFTARDFSYLVFDTLFAVDDKWQVKPQMVDTWTKSADGATWTFTLRDGLTFHDGTAVTSEDCVASLRRWGARDTMGAALLKAAQTLEPVDAKTFKLVLKEPYGLVLQALSKPGAMVPMIMPKRLADTPPTRPIIDPVGSGPYSFVKEEYRPGDRIVLKRHAAYKPRSEPSVWASGAKVAHFERVELISMPDVSTQVSGLLTGEVDYLERLPPDVLPILERNRLVKVQVVSPYGYQGIMRFNHVAAPFDNVKVRRAVMQAVNQADYLAAVAVRSEFGRECRSMYGCGTTYETSAGMPAFDFEAAKREIAASGADLSKPVVILHPADAPGIAALGLVTQDLLTKLGFKVELATMDLNTFFGRRTRPEGWHIFHTTNTVPDMQTPLQNVYMGGVGAPAGFAGWPKDEEVEKLRAAFAATSSEAEAKSIAEAIHKRAAEAGFYMPLGQFVGPSAWRAELANVPVGPAMFLWGLRRAS